MSRKKPELIDVKVIRWDDHRGIYGLMTIFDDGEQVTEPWGTRIDTEYQAAVRRCDIVQPKAKKSIRFWK